MLLPPDISSGSIVDVTVSRNLNAEQQAETAFNNLQDTIYSTFGVRSPSPPVLRVRNTTQTSVVLEWDAIDCATAQLRGLSMYRDGARIGAIPKARETRSTKITGLAIDTDYEFQLVLRTSAGTFASDRLRVRTHKMTDLRGIVVCAGAMPAALRASLAAAVARIGARLGEAVRLDTTHFVCTEGRGPAWEKAVAQNIPVVVPDWVLGCEREGRVVGVRAYYLGADPRLRHVGPSAPQLRELELQRERDLRRHGELQAVEAERRGSLPETPTTNVIPPTPERATARERVNGADDDDDDDEEEERASPGIAPKAEGPESHETALAAEPPTEEEEEEVRESRVGRVDGEEEEEEEDEGDDEPEEHKHPASVLPERTKATVDDAPEEEASFQDVAL